MLKNLTLNIFTATALCGLMAAAAHAWSDPILVTPDSALSKHSRVVFDNDGNLHFFFSNNRFQEGVGNDFEVFHCKFTPDGQRLTEDLRLSNSHTYEAYPAPLLGQDLKIHLIWDDRTRGPATTDPGIYYARLDIDGNIERPATLIFDGRPDPPRLFQDSEGNLNAVWINHDSLYFGKFDTTGQVIITNTLVYAAPSIDLYNLEACMDSQDQIHCTYRNYYGTWDEWNLGYSRVNNQGEVLISYAPLTPEIPGIVCGRGCIVSDAENNLHMSYLYDEYGTAYQYYRKIDRNLFTLYDIRVENVALSGSQVGNGGIALNCEGNIVLAWAHNQSGIQLQYKSVIYTTDGVALSVPETIYEDYDMRYPDLATGQFYYYVFDWTGPMPASEEGGILYSCERQVPAVEWQVPNTSIREINISIYPNPFNDKTTFQLQWPRGCEVNVQVMDPAGRIIYDYGRFFLQGTRSFLLDKRLSSGIYYIVVISDQTGIVKSIIQLK